MNAQCLSPTEDDVIRMDLQKEYQTIVGHVRYLADSTRPCIAYNAAMLGSALHRPTERHMELLKSVLRYLKGSGHKGIQFKFGNYEGNAIGQLAVQYQGQALKAYSDAYFGTDFTASRSTSGAFVTFNGAPIA